MRFIGEFRPILRFRIRYADAVLRLAAAFLLLPAPPVEPAASSPDASFGVVEERRLLQPVTVSRRFGLLTEAVSDLAVGTGAPLSVAPAMRNLKVVVLTGPGRPAVLTMRDLADLFDAEWRRAEGGGWRLGFIPALAAEREARLQAEERSRREGVLKEMRRLARTARTWGDNPEAEMNRAGAEVDAIPETEKERKAAARAEYEERWGTGGFSWPKDLLLGNLLATLDEADWSKLLAGELIWGSTDPVPGGRAIPKWSIETYSDRGRTLEPLKDVWRVFLRFDPVEGRLSFASASDGRDSRGWSGTTDALPNAGWLRTADDAFSRRLAAWRSPITKGTEPILDAVARQGVPPGKSPWYSDFEADPTITLADSLARLYDEFGTPVVGEALRRRDYRRHRIGFGQASLRAALLDWFGGSDRPGTVRLARGAVLFRPSGYWTDRRSEPDEAAARRLERSGGSSLDAYAELDGTFDLVQRLDATLSANRVNSSPLGAPVLLRLWRTLTPEERADLLRGRSVRGRPGLALDVIFADAVFTGGIKGEILRRFDGGTVAWQGLGLFGKLGSVMRQATVWDSSGIGSSGARSPRLSVETLTITVGESAQDGIEISCDLPGGKRERKRPYGEETRGAP